MYINVNTLHKGDKKYNDNDDYDNDNNNKLDNFVGFSHPFRQVSGLAKHLKIC